jgi:excisionase family DNA binding protein
MEQGPQTASTAEAAAILRTSSHRVRAHIHEGNIRAVKHGRRMLITQAALEQFLEGQK